MLSGTGTFTYASGASYTGSFVAGKYHGEGQYKWPNGTTYTGGFFEGVIHGEGTYTDEDNRQWQGHFHNGTVRALSLAAAAPRPPAAPLATHHRRIASRGIELLRRLTTPRTWWCALQGPGLQAILS